MRRGFTMVELLIYVSIFAVVSVVLIYTATVFIRIDTEQAASTEVANQANFILQRIQSYISAASSTLIVVNDNEDDETDKIPLGSPYTKLVVKTSSETTSSDDPNSPIAIYRNGDFIEVKQGLGSDQKIFQLNSAKVRATSLTFTKYQNASGRDVVKIDVALENNAPAPQQKVQRSLILGVGKALAAVFDTGLQPRSNNSLDIGVSGTRWKDLFLSGNIDVTGTSKLGSSGDAFTALKKGTISVNPPNITAGTAGYAFVAFTGAVASDLVFLTPPQLENGLIFTSASSTTNTINIKFFNASAGSIDGAAQNWAYIIIK